MNVYVWNDTWVPGENTVAYYPFTSDILDHSGNSKNLTGSGYSFANNKMTSTSTLEGPVMVPTSGTEPRTINAWITYSSDSNYAQYFFTCSSGGPTGAIYNISDGIGGQLKIGATWYTKRETSASGMALVTMVKNGTSMKTYKNGTLIGEATISTDQWSFNSTQTKSQLLKGTYGEIVIEKIAWTQAQIQGYYNQTKSLYGIS